MLKNTRMRFLAIAFAISLVGCVDQVTPVGVDDIEENTDDFGPDQLKDPDNAPTQLPREVTSNQAGQLQPDTNNVAGTLQVEISPQDADVVLNPVPRR